MTGQATDPATTRVGVWYVAWSNPTRPRPDGFPQIILAVRTPLRPGQGAGTCPPEIHECWEEMREYGYAVGWALEAPPARTLPLHSKQRIRRRNLWKRLLAKTPMFVEDFYTQAVLARPEYYGPYIAGEFADVQFARSTMGNLRTVDVAR